jgi:hypothetical protein
VADPVSLAITVAINAAAMAMTASKKIEGPRLDDLKASTADYGTPLVQFYGTKRLECPTIYAEDIREEKSTSKTKGGKYTQYKYFGTWASFVADHEIDSVIKLFLDRHLAFDRSGSGPIDPLFTNGDFTLKPGGQNWRIYLGTETQRQDPRLLAKIVAKEGPGTCPAYLGISYMVFEDVPLEVFGNHLPQVSVIATRVSTPAYPYESHPTVEGNSAMFASGGGWMTVAVAASAGNMEWWELPSRTLVSKTSGIDVFSGTVDNVSMASDGTAYFVGQYIGPFGVVHTALYRVSPAAGGATRIDSDTLSAWFSGPTRVFDPQAGRQVLTGTRLPYTSSGYLSFGNLIETAGSGNAHDFCIDSDEQTWGLFILPSSASFSILPIGAGTGGGTMVGPVVRGPAPSGDVAISFVESENHFAVVTDGYFLAIDADTFTIKTSRAVSLDLLNFPYNNPFATSFWSNFNEISLVDGTTIRTVNPLSWVFEDTGSVQKFFDPINDAIVTRPQFAAHLTWRFLDRENGTGWTLADICADVAQQCGMLPAAYDFVDLDQNVPGYAWTQGAGKDVIGALLELHDSDIRPHGFIQQGLKRGKQLAGGTISTEWMVRETQQGNEGPQPLYSIPITSETDLPLRIAATFADPNMEEQPNTAHAQRNAASVKTTRELSFDLTTLNEEPETVQPMIERALRRAWVGATKPKFLLTPLEIRLEPADVRTVLLEDGERLRCRATRVVVRANRVLDTEWELDGETQVNPPSWELDDASPLNAVFSTPGGFTYGRPPDTVPVAGKTKGFIFDTPLLADSQDQTAPFLYDAAGPYSESVLWPGASVWTSDDNASDSTFTGGWDLFRGDESTVWGNCTTTLPAAATDVLDEGSSLDITLIGGGTLTSVTTDELLNDQSLNLALIGDELIQFRDATAIATAKYRISGFVRGARNSEYAVADHVDDENFILIGSHVHKRTIGASEIGDTDYYRFSSTGLDVDTGVETLTVPFAANAQRPPAPAHLALARNPITGDWAISWVRRSRIGGSSVNGQDVPLGETSEAYRVKIMNGSTVVATYNVTSPSLAYTSAEQVADWGGAQTSLTVEVCQMSPALSLEGFLSTASG